MNVFKGTPTSVLARRWADVVNAQMELPGAYDTIRFFADNGWTPPPDPPKRWTCNDNEIYDGKVLHFTAVGPYEAQTLVDILNEHRP